MDLTAILEATVSPDTRAVLEAQQQLEQAAEKNLVSVEAACCIHAELIWCVGHFPLCPGCRTC